MRMYRYVDRTASPENRNEERDAAKALALKRYPDASEVQTGLRDEGRVVYVTVWRHWDESGDLKACLFDYLPPGLQPTT
jgi:hypothetical protein